MTEEQNDTAKQDETDAQQFIWVDDTGSRKPIADGFTKIITQKETPFVMCLDVGFGFGKTFFMTRWAQQLERQGHTVFYFNAWQSDYTGEPLVAFAMEFLEFLTEEKTIKKNGIANTIPALIKKNSLPLKNFTASSATIIAGMLQAGVKQFSYGIIDIEAQKGKFDERKMKKMAEGMAVSKVKAHLEIKKSIDELKENIKKICKNIKRKKGAKALPIYVMVDELDRCRPSFAIEFLELIKHFFDVEGLMFIIATDQNQLQHSVKAIYGEGYDGQGYLRRFFDLELSLPEIPKHIYIATLCRSHGLRKSFPDDPHHLFYGMLVFIYNYGRYADFFGLSLRDIERGMVLTEIVLNLMVEENRNFFPPIFGFLIAARQYDIKFYNQIGTGLKEPDDILKVAQKISGKDKYFDISNFEEKYNFKPLLLMATKDHKTLTSEHSNFKISLNDIAGDEKRLEVLTKIEIYEKAMGLREDLEKVTSVFKGKLILTYLKEKINSGASYTNHYSN